jgi:hypothetical protein
VGALDSRHPACRAGRPGPAVLCHAVARPPLSSGRQPPLPQAITAPRRHCRRGGLLLLVLPALLPPQSQSGDHYILSILNFNDDTVSLFHLVLAFIS